MARSPMRMYRTFFFPAPDFRTPIEQNPTGNRGGERGPLASCSCEASYFGNLSALPISMEREACAQAKTIKGDMDFSSDRSHGMIHYCRNLLGAKRDAVFYSMHRNLEHPENAPYRNGSMIILIKDVDAIQHK